MSTDHPPENQPLSGAANSASQDVAGSVQGEALPAGRGHARVSDAIERRYLRVDNRYFFPDRTLAFIDDGRRIRVKTENREVLHSVVAIAQVRGWRVIALKGTETFRQAMWREATLRGIEVRGYEPTEAEILQAQRASKRSPPPQGRESGTSSTHPTIPENSDAATVRDGSESAGASHGADPHSTGATQENRPVHKDPRSSIEGLLLAAAAAPYQFDPAQRMSFYVTVRTQVGDRTVWGTDLERAFAESASQPRIGDQVVLTRHGAHPVKVRLEERNADGELVGNKKVVMQRVLWSVETPGHLRAMEGHAMRVRAGESLSDEVRRQHPELAIAAANLELAEQYAQRVTSDQASRQHLVQLIRERMADALAQGLSIHLPDRRPGPLPTPMQVRHRMARSLEALNHDRV